MGFFKISENEKICASRIPTFIWLCGQLLIYIVCDWKESLANLYANTLIVFTVKSTTLINRTFNNLTQRNVI